MENCLEDEQLFDKMLLLSSYHYLSLMPLAKKQILDVVLSYSNTNVRILQFLWIVTICHQGNLQF